MKKILLVDDHPDIRRMMRFTLGKSFEIHEAEDGQSALDVARQIKPDVVVLDIMMPGGLDGLQVLDAIRSDSELQSTLVILASARGQASDIEIGIQKKADAYFVKPFSPLQLIACIQETLSKGIHHV